MNILGIDLAGKTTNPTGICVLTYDKTIFSIVYSDNQILEIVDTYNPEIIAIDAPIMKGEPKIREADRILKKYKAFTPSLPGMRSLTLRGSKLVEQLKPFYKVIEVFPTATAKILGVYDKNYEKIAKKLKIKVNNKHELDAYLCCLTAKMYLEEKTVEIGDKKGKIIIPK